MNVVKDLQKIAKRNAESALKEANSILSLQDEKDNNMLSFFGTHEVQKDNKHKAIQAERMLSSGRVNSSDVKKICRKYDLRCVSSKEYQHPIPIKVLNDLRIFQEQHNLGASHLSDRLYVIAPLSHFKSVWPTQKDPILLFDWGQHRYGFSDSQNLQVVSTWGNDFTAFRLIRGMFKSYWIAIYFLLAGACGLFIGGIPGFFSCISVSGFLLGGYKFILQDTDKADWDNNIKWIP